MGSIKKTKLSAKFFQTGKGSEPVRDWLKDLPREEKKSIGADIMTVQFGWPIGMPLVRHLGDGIWEVRTNLPRGKIARVLFFMHGNAMILLHGFIKKTQKTPKEELELAKRRMRQFEQDKR